MFYKVYDDFVGGFTFEATDPPYPKAPDLNYPRIRKSSKEGSQTQLLSVFPARPQFLNFRLPALDDRQ